MRSLALHIPLFSALTFGLGWAWFSTLRGFDAMVPASWLAAVALFIGAIIGLFMAAAFKSSRLAGIILTLLYLGGGAALVGQSYYDERLGPDCKWEVKKQYRESPNMATLSTWCVDSRLLKDLLRTAENANHFEGFEWILDQGIGHPAPDCARLGMSVASLDAARTRVLLARGISPQCKSFNRTPLERLYALRNPDSKRAQEIYGLLAETGSNPAQEHLLLAILGGNHSLLAKALEHVDPNFGADQVIKYSDPGTIKNPLALSIRMLDLKAAQMLIDAGADVSPRPDALKIVQNMKDQPFSYYEYALKRKKNIDYEVKRHPGQARYLDRQATINQFVELLRGTDPVEADKIRQQETQLAQEREREAEREQRAQQLQARLEAAQGNFCDTADQGIQGDTQYGSPDITSVAAGEMHSCAVVDGEVWCWGNNGKRQLGDGTSHNRYCPTRTEPLDSEIIQVTAGNKHTCALSARGQAWCWGSNVNGQLCGDCAEKSTGSVVGIQPITGINGRIESISAGGLHTAAVVDNSALVWGRIDYEYQGEPYSGAPRGFSTNPEIPDAVVSARAGGQTYFPTTCAVTEIGDVYCWGTRGDTRLRSRQELPAKAIDAGSGDGYGCALLVDGKVYCWGRNFNGYLGAGEIKSSVTPVAVKRNAQQMLDGVTQLVVGSTHSCAITEDTALYCWGSNRDGKLGLGRKVRQASFAERVMLAESVPITGVTQVTVGPYHSCAVAERKLYCWGQNKFGQLGQGLEDREFKFEEPVTDLIAGLTYSCVRLANERVDCWGNLPQDSERTYKTLFPTTLISAESKVRLVAGGGRHYPFFCFAYTDSFKCVGWLRTEFRTTSKVRLLVAGFTNACVADEHDLWCWGGRDEGDPQDVNIRHTPQKITGIEARITAVGVGESHFCAIAEGDIWCWGYNRSGQLGDGTKTTSNIPVKVRGLDARAVAIALGLKHSCALLENGKTYCWGDAPYRTAGEEKWQRDDKGLPHEVIDLDGPTVSLVAGEYFTCALSTNGEVHCWGTNLDGELVPGRHVSTIKPLKVNGLNGEVRSIAAGHAHACALLESGTVQCWGDYEPENMGQSGFYLYPAEVRFDKHP